MTDLVICDAQVHAPRVDPVGRLNGIDEGPLLAEMAAAGVDRAIIVPLRTRSPWSRNREALEMAGRHPDRFAVMGLLPDEAAPGAPGELAAWPGEPGLLGVRVSCALEPMRTLLLDDALDALWAAAEANGLPVMLYAPDGAGKIARVAGRHPGLRLVVDHLGLAPFVQHDDLGPAVRRLEPLAAFPNVAVKASSIPSSVAGPYPFRTAHEPLRRVVGAFGAHRVFWGSDLTRLPCSYRECVTMFTEELDFLTDDDRRLIMGRAICDWLGWPIDRVD